MFGQGQQDNYYMNNINKQNNWKNNQPIID